MRSELKMLDKGACVPQVALFVALAELGREPDGHLTQYALPVGGAGDSALLVFDQLVADVPVQLNERGIDLPHGPRLGLGDEGTQGGVQIGELLNFHAAKIPPATTSGAKQISTAFGTAMPALGSLRGDRGGHAGRPAPLPYQLLNQQYQDVDGFDVDFLDAVGVATVRGADFDIAVGGELATVLASEGNHLHTSSLGGLGSK